MKTLKNILIGILFLFISLLVIATLLPSTYHVERSIVIHQPASIIFEQVVNLNNWQKWDAWTEMDQDAQQIVSSPSRGKGAKRTWDGEVIGAGSLTILDVNENQSLTTQLVFLEPQKSTSTGRWTFEEVEVGKTKVTWSNEGNLNYPDGRLFGLFLDKMIGGDFEKGLSKLKNITENKQNLSIKK